ncbi:MAG: protein translocase subunit SecF [bacterium]|nr:protein translocase subunit SecF [bacterium]
MINFLKYWKLYATISVLVIGFGLYAMIKWGFTYSIDFVGGTNVHYSFSTTIDEPGVREVVAQLDYEIVAIDVEQNEVSMRLAAINEQQEQALRQKLSDQYASEITIIRSETVGPVIGAETLRKTGIASIIAIIGILLYITYAFRNLNFAMAAIVALVHDALVVVGIYALFSHFLGAQLDTLFVTALLTTMSFSVHDTIVVFDQIRDYRKRYGKGNIAEYANRSLTETMVRSLNNSVTIIFMLLALVLLGGTTIRFFALTLLVGTITGTYSSPFIATPVAVWFEKMRK